jgi:hypothetical protein
MEQAKDKKLYEEVKELAKKKYKRYPSLYASAWIQKEYQARGGTYITNKETNKNKNIDKWFEEKWVQVIPFLRGKVVECGSSNKSTKACRPMVKVDPSTPLTMNELLTLHSKEDILKFSRLKNKNMKKRANWAKLEFY